MPAKRYCCVVGCKNTEQNHRELKFYSFPNRSYEVERKKRWIQAVKRITADNKPWEPNRNTRICSAHFVGGEKSSIQNHPAYIPTIFPSIYKKKTMSEAAATRHVRLLKRKENTNISTELPNLIKQQEPGNFPRDFEMVLVSSIDIKMEAIEATSVGSQTDIYDYEEKSNPEPNILFCSMGVNNEASTQTNIYIQNPQKAKRVIISGLKTTHDKCCGPDIVTRQGFTGFSDIKTENTMLQLGGVSLKFFRELFDLINVKTVTQPLYHKVLSKEDRLLLFLMKMKLGLSFYTLACIFNIHYSTVSRIFVGILATLTEKTKDWIYWPPKESIEAKVPVALRKYPMCRCLIDCVEVFTDTPSTVEQRVLMHSSSKSGFSMKYFIVFTPDGLVCKISKGYGGSVTDSYIAKDSGFFELIGSGDMVLADKDYPEIKSDLLKRGVSLVVPPLILDPELNKKHAERQSVRRHVERAIQRPKLCNVSEVLPVQLLPHIDSIMHMCCVMANGKPPLIRTKGESNE